MKRILRGAVLLAVTAVLGACGTEPDQVKGGVADHIIADPGVVFISRADSQSVKIRLEDAQGTALHDPISISNVGAGINVRPDSAFRPIFTNGDSLVFNTNGTELRVWVSTSALANSSFTINAGGLTLNVPVVVTPNKNESFPFSNLAPVLGEVVTATVTSDLLFTDSTKVVFGNQTLTPVSVDPTGASLTFNVGPDLIGPATFTNVTLSYNKDVVFPVTAADTMNSPSGAQDFTFSNLTPGIGEQITVTPPAGVRFTPDTSGTKVTFDSLGPLPRFTVAPDGSSMTLTAGPNSVGANTFTKMVNPANPGFSFTLHSTDTLVSARVDSFLVNLSTATPTLGSFVTITGANASFRFKPTASFTLGGRAALSTTVATDSNSASVLFEPGASGRIVEKGGLVSLFPLDLPTNRTAAMAPATLKAGTDLFATAPAITVPAAVNDTVGFWDGAPYGFDAADDFGGGARLYKITVTAGQKIKFQLPYISDGADLGVYFYDGAEAALPGSFAVDSKGGGSGDAESGTLTFTTAGTYYVAIVYFEYTTGSTPSPKPAKYYLFRMIGQ
jgi:hypothetical protein